MTWKASIAVARLAAIAMATLCLMAPPDVARAEDLTTVAPVMGCEDLLALDLTGLDGAPARLGSAEVVEDPEDGLATCVVQGRVASDVNFEIRLSSRAGRSAS